MVSIFRCFNVLIPARYLFLYSLRHYFKLGIGQYQPFATDVIEVYLYARIRALALIVKHNTFAELPVYDSLPQR